MLGTQKRDVEFLLHGAYRWGSYENKEVMKEIWGQGKLQKKRITWLGSLRGLDTCWELREREADTNSADTCHHSCPNFKQSQDDGIPWVMRNGAAEMSSGQFLMRSDYHTEESGLNQETWCPLVFVILNTWKINKNPWEVLQETKRIIRPHITAFLEQSSSESQPGK